VMSLKTLLGQFPSLSDEVIASYAEVGEEVSDEALQAKCDALTR